MFTNSLSDSVVKQSFKEAVAADNQARKEEASKRLDYFHDAQTEHVVELLKTYITKAERLRPCFINVVKKVINQLAMVYIQDARREIDGSEQDKKIFAEIAESTALSLKMKIANRYAKLLKTVLLRPVWRKGKMDLDVLTPNILDVKFGDTPEDLEAVLITHNPESNRSEEVEYSHWTPEIVERLDYRGNAIKSDENPYKTLPFVPVWDYCPADTFWLGGGDDLISIQDSINEKLTELMFVLRFQGFGVGYIIGDRGGIGAIHQCDPGAMFSLPEGGELGFAKTNAPITEIIGTIDFLVKQAAITNGLSSSSLTTDPQDESGVSKIVGNRELEEIRRDDIALFRAYEKRLFDVFRVVWNAHNPGRKIGDSAELKVDFYDVRQSLPAEDQAALWEKLINLGVISAADIVMERNPDLTTREQAYEYLVKIQAENDNFRDDQLSNKQWNSEAAAEDNEDEE